MWQFMEKMDATKSQNEPSVFVKDNNEVVVRLFF